MIRDDNGVHIYDADANFERTLELPSGAKVYGVLPVRAKGGMLAIFAQFKSGYKLIFYNRNLTEQVGEVSLQNFVSKLLTTVARCKTADVKKTDDQILWMSWKYALPIRYGL